MSFRYNQTAGTICTALRFQNTIVPMTLMRLDFWMFMGLHCLFLLLYHKGVIPDSQQKHSPWRVSWNDMKILTAITTFFEVFYTNQCYNRYKAGYSSTMHMFRSVIRASFESNLHLREQSPQHVFLGNRYHLAAMLVFFDGVVYQRDDLTKGFADRILEESEKKYLAYFEPEHRPLVLLQWSGEIFQEAHTTSRAPANILKSITDKVLRTRIYMQEVVDMKMLPMPFQYFHLLNVMLCVNCSLWAYLMGTTFSIAATISFIICLVIFLGMVHLANGLSDPFGEDEVDFPMQQWLEEVWILVVRLSNSNCFHKDKAWVSQVAKENDLVHPAKPRNPHTKALESKLAKGSSFFSGGRSC